MHITSKTTKWCALAVAGAALGLAGPASAASSGAVLARGQLSDAEAADLTQRDFATLSEPDQSALHRYYADIVRGVNPSVFRGLLNQTTTANPRKGLGRREDKKDAAPAGEDKKDAAPAAVEDEYVPDPPCLERGELNRCAAVFVDKGVPGGVKVWNIMLEEDYRWDDVCGRAILDKFRTRCNSFPVWVKDWRCDRIDYLFYGTNVNVPWGTVWINFITRSSCQEEWAEEWIREVTQGEVQTMCVALDLSQLPAPLDFQEMRASLPQPGAPKVKGTWSRRESAANPRAKLTRLVSGVDGKVWIGLDSLEFRPPMPEEWKAPPVNETS